MTEAKEPIKVSTPQGYSLTQNSVRPGWWIFQSPDWIFQSPDRLFHTSNHLTTEELEQLHILAAMLGPCQDASCPCRAAGEEHARETVSDWRRPFGV